MPDLTLIEYAKGLAAARSTEAVMVMEFAKSSDIFEALRFEGLGEGNPTFEGMRESELPTTVAFRDINGASTSGAGKLEAFSEATYIMDHDIDLDVAIERRYGSRRLAQHTNMAAARAGKVWTDTFTAGSNATNPKEFDGLLVRAGRFSNRTIHNSVASGGAALSLYSLDRAIANTMNPTHIMASWNLMPRFTQAARTTALSGFVAQDWDGVGRAKMTYAGLPVLWGYAKDKHGVILPYSEVGQGGGSAVTTSLYVLSLTEGGLRGIQLKPLSIVGPKLLENEITLRSHLSWDTGIVDENEFCMTRLTSITDAAFVA